jgi:hypothetical protein
LLVDPIFGYVIERYMLATLKLNGDFLNCDHGASK